MCLNTNQGVRQLEGGLSNVIRSTLQLAVICQGVSQLRQTQVHAILLAELSCNSRPIKSLKQALAESQLPNKLTQFCLNKFLVVILRDRFPLKVNNVFVYFSKFSGYHISQ